MDNELKEQSNSRPWLFKKGQSGNPKGRPKGSISLKEYAKKYLANLDDEGKEEFMEGLSKDIIWKMAEGAPQTNTDITSGGKPIPLFDNVTKTNGISDNNGNE